MKMIVKLGVLLVLPLTSLSSEQEMLTTIEISNNNYEQLIIAEWYDDVIKVIEKTVKKPRQEQDGRQKKTYQQNPRNQEQQVNKQNSNYSYQLSRDDIAKIQVLLNERGFNVGNPDGISGAKTTIAIKQYQRQVGLTVNGNPSYELLDHLYSQTKKKPSLPPKNTIQQNRYVGNSVVAFGIKLGERFDSRSVARVINKGVMGGTIEPHNPNPLFSEYKISLNKNIVTGIKASSSKLNQNCDKTMPQLIGTLQNKYGKGRISKSRDSNHASRSFIMWNFYNHDWDPSSKNKKSVTIKARCDNRKYGGDVRMQSYIKLEYHYTSTKRSKKVPYSGVGL